MNSTSAATAEDPVLILDRVKTEENPAVQPHQDAYASAEVGSGQTQELEWDIQKETVLRNIDTAEQPQSQAKILQKRMNKFFLWNLKVDRYASTYLCPRKRIDYENPEVYVQLDALVLYGTDYFTINDIKNYFSSAPKEILFINDSSYRVAFDNAQTLRNELKPKLVDEQGQLSLHKQYQIKPHEAHPNSSRKMFARYATSQDTPENVLDASKFVDRIAKETFRLKNQRDKDNILPWARRRANSRKPSTQYQDKGKCTPETLGIGRSSRYCPSRDREVQLRLRSRSRSQQEQLSFQKQNISGQNVQDIFDSESAVEQKVEEGHEQSVIDLTLELQDSTAKKCRDRVPEIYHSGLQQSHQYGIKGFTYSKYWKQIEEKQKLKKNQITVIVLDDES